MITEQNMQTGSKAEEVLLAPSFKKLVTVRWRVSLFMASLMLVVYFGFILLIAFNKEFLAQKIGTHITLGLPLGIGIIVFAWILTGIYVRWANSKYDTQVENIKKQFKL